VTTSHDAVIMQDFIGARGRCLPRKRGRDDFEDQNPLDNQEWSSDEEENDLDAEVSSSSSSDEDGRDDVEKVGTPLHSGVLKKRKSTEASTSNAKRQQLPLSGNNSSAATILPQAWRDAVDLIMLESGTQITTVGKNWLSSSSHAPVVAICGARNVGKSTFARFLVNSLLNRYSECPICRILVCDY
jgi:pantothenate kinase